MLYNVEMKGFVIFVHFYFYFPVCFAIMNFPSAILIYLHVSNNEPSLKSEISAVFVYNNRRQMTQMNLMNKNMKNLVLNPGQLVRLVLGWVDC